jgi:hypothetical protein
LKFLKKINAFNLDIICLDSKFIIASQRQTEYFALNVFDCHYRMLDSTFKPDLYSFFKYLSLSFSIKISSSFKITIYFSEERRVLTFDGGKN